MSTSAQPPRPEHPELKPWLGPPAGRWVGGFVPWNIALSRGENHYIALTDFFAFPSGVAFTIQAVLGPGSLAPAPQNNDFPSPGFSSDMGSMLQLFGALQVVLTDGDKAVRNPKVVAGNNLMVPC